MGALRAPGILAKSIAGGPGRDWFIAETAEDAERLVLAATAGAAVFELITFLRGPAFLVVPIFPALSACLALDDLVFLLIFASVSASHAFLAELAAARLLCHTAEPSSSAICSSGRPLRTESFSSSGSKLSTAYWSRFLMSSHSFPLLPGRRDRIRASTNSPLSFFPCRRNFRSPFFSISEGSPSGSQVPVSHTITVPAP